MEQTNLLDEILTCSKMTVNLLQRWEDKSILMSNKESKIGWHLAYEANF